MTQQDKLLSLDSLEEAFKQIAGDGIKHRDTEGMSDISKQIINSCPNAYVQNGIVHDPCHVWFGAENDPTKWGE